MNRPSLNNLTDILDQFNEFGFHDICNFHDSLFYISSLELFHNPDLEPVFYFETHFDPNRRPFVHNLFEMMLFSERDSRFAEFAECFALLFDLDIDVIMREFNELRSL